MRALNLMAGIALGLAACGNDGQSANTTNADDSLTAESIVANDVTAIDAVTASAANIAADVDINFTTDMLEPAGKATGARAPAKSGPAARPARPRQSPPPAAEPASEPAADTAGNATE